MGSGKRVAVLVRRSPLNSVKDSEALRQSVGLTLAGNKVTAVLLDAAAWLAVPMSPSVVGGGEVGKHIETLLQLEGRVEVERESLERFRISDGEVMAGIGVVSAEEVVAGLTESEAVIVF
ncbi:MAG: DsrE family protein [Chloroflexota bacterium]